MLPFVIGTVPYVTAWVLVLNNFFSQLEDMKVTDPDIYDKVPEWVTYAVAGTCVIFTLFTFPQLWYQWVAPRYYWKTELWYCFLSATSKFFLGFLLYQNVLLRGSVDEALSLHNTTAVNITALMPTV